MSGWSDVLPAFALGAALGAAPGPVQVVILSETARGGITRGLRVMAGANGTLLVVMVALAFGFSALQPSEAVLRGLRVLGGGFLIYLAMVELRSLRAEARGDDGRRSMSGDGLGPTARGVVSVILNPGAWIFFATTASTVMAEASARGGRSTAIVAAVAMTLGVSCTDMTAILVGTGGRALAGERGLRWVRMGLALALFGIGSVFVVQGVRGR
jgi:threonine/homoserine/homoserine lactone efflux protein